VTKQWITKWPYIANAVFPIVQNHAEKCHLGKFWGGDRPPSLDQPLVESAVVLGWNPIYTPHICTFCWKGTYSKSWYQCWWIFQ